MPVPQSCTSGRRCGVPHADKPWAVRDTSPFSPRPHQLEQGRISSDTIAFTRRARSADWESGPERAGYTVGILVPIVALAPVASLGGESCRRAGELPSGGIVEWIFRRSVIRQVVVYARVALWLLLEHFARMPRVWFRHRQTSTSERVKHGKVQHESQQTPASGDTSSRKG